MAFASHGVVLPAVVILLALAASLANGAELGRSHPMIVEVLGDKAGSVVVDSGSPLMRRKHSHPDVLQIHRADPVTRGPNAGAEHSGSWLMRAMRRKIRRWDDVQGQNPERVIDYPSASFASVDNSGSRLMRRKISRVHDAQGQDPGPIADNAAAATSKYPDPHTWGDKKKNVLGLPSWVAVIIGGIIAAFIVIVTNVIGNRLAHPLPFFSTEDQKVKDQIEQAREKVRLLEIALGTKREQERKEAEEEARRAAGEPPLPSGPTEDELVGEVLYRTEQVQRNVVGGINESIQQAAPMLARASHVQSVFEHNVNAVQERAKDVTMREFASMYKELKTATGDSGLTDTVLDTATSDLRNLFHLDDGNDLDPPPFALLLGGMFAPVQIKGVRSQCNTQIIWNSVILATCAACAIMDMHHTCNDNVAKIWFLGLLSINLLDIFFCAFIASRCTSQLASLHDHEENQTRIRSTGNSVWDLYINLQVNSTQFFKAYFAYQQIIDGAVYTCQKIVSFVSLFWGAFGVYLSIAHIIQDTLSCDAKIAVWFMHVYSGFFLVLSTWTMLALFIWVVQRLSHSIAVITPLMKAAQKSDEEVPFRFPLFQIITRSFVLRDSSTMLRIKARSMATDVDTMEAEIEDIKSRLEHRKYTLRQLDDCRVAAVKHEADVMEKYKKRVREMGGALPDEASAAEAALDSEAGLAGSSSSAFGATMPDTVGTAITEFASQTRENYRAATASIDAEDGLLDASDARAAAAFVGGEVQAAAGLLGSQAHVLAQQAQAAAQSAAASARVAATSTAESSLQQPLLQEVEPILEDDVVATEPEASANSSLSPETQPAQDTENLPESF